MSQGVLAIAEQLDGAFRKVTFEAVSEGKKIAAGMGCSLTVVVPGSGMESVARDLAKYGADKIIIADNAALKEYTTDAYANVVADIIGKEDPAVVILGATAQGKDLAPRLAARLDAAIAIDVIEIKVDGDSITATRPMYGGKLLADVVLEGTPKIIATRPNAMGVLESDGAGAVETVSADVGETAIRFVEKTMESNKLELTEADIIVSGGRGMGGGDFAILEALAAAMGGAVGASRVAVDEGWRAHSDQVGQTGKVVSPNLYVACGISGAIQHLAGMSSSKVVVAINKDPDAPIFSKADYGVVGDLFELVPAITEEIKAIKG
ncbi:MAG: electron transfer flavoprotein subunit alpha/FixB family protein [Desulfobacterales bacterium]|nr:electron transfer flavoprotein subunit alpha/FixB family protein [Desulfobacterales bacterium]